MKQSITGCESVYFLENEDGVISERNMTYQMFSSKEKAINYANQHSIKYTDIREECLLEILALNGYYLDTEDL
jgi:hypothetical protein